MLSPQSPKRAAPSIWSVDSGYRSGSLFSTSLEELALSQPFGTHTNPPNGFFQSPIEEYKDASLAGAWNTSGEEQFVTQKEEPSIDPIVTKLNAFKTEESFDSDYFLPELKKDGETCIMCEFWKITNPEEDITCEKCQIPGIVEPALLVFANSLPSPDEKDIVPLLRKPKNARGKALETSDFATRCSACELSALINPSAPSSCQSCSPNPDLPFLLSPAESECKVRRSRAGRNSKLPLQALNQLQSWLDANQDNPYPSAEVKRQLAQDCGITEKQINTWMTNARARQLSPLDTWLSSGSEDDGAHESDIASAAGTPVYSTGFSYLSESHAPGYRRAGSVSGSSAFSAGNTRPQPSRRGKKKNYRRTNQPPQITEVNSPTLTRSPVSQARGNPNPSDQEMWQCTYCRRQLVPKSWRRHEETQHKPKAEWTCMLYGPSLLRSNSLSNCVFCMEKNPCEDHFNKHHRIHECVKRPIKERTFYRPDHLRQHVKNFHGATLYDIVQGRWKRAAEVGEKGHTCGFCGVWLETWDKRETHIAGHFKDGLTMEVWRDPEIWEAEKKEVAGEEMDVDMEQGRAKEKAKDKKQKDMAKDEKLSGLARISRTFSFTRRRSTRIPAPSSYSQPPTTFANTFMPIPTPVSHPPLSYPLDPTSYSSAPALPYINQDPLMNVDDGFGNVFDWSQLCTTSGNASGMTGLDMSMPETQFGSTAYDPDFERAMAEYGNMVDQHGCGNEHVWGPG